MMKNLLSGIVLVAMVVLHAAAVDMSLYSPTKDVDAEFQTFLKELYAETEDPASTTTFTDFFAPEGSLKVLQYSAVGAEKITGLKQALMPTTGKKLWHHLPNVTTVSAEDDTMRTYTVLGVIQTTHEGVNCSQAHYTTKFIVAKDDDKAPKLLLRSGSLLLYDDFIVDPAVSPTDIPCQSGAEPVLEPSGRDEL